MTWFAPWVLAAAGCALVAGFGVEVSPLLRHRRPPPAPLYARGLLWGGTAMLWLFVAGYEGSVMPGASARFLATWTACFFSGVSLWRHWIGRRADALIAIAWMAGVFVLAVTSLRVFGVWR